MSFLATGASLALYGGVTAGSVAAGAALAGTAASLYGASKQRSANAKAQDQNIAQQDKQNNATWTNWLMTRGISPSNGQSFTAGQVPTAGQYQVSNVRLPLWATMSVPQNVAGRASGGSGRITLTGTARNPASTSMVPSSTTG